MSRDVRDVPGADDVPAAVGVGPDLLDDLGDLVDVAAVGRRPGAPLVAVDRAEVAVLVGPLVPDRDAAVLQPLDVRVAAEEPQQLGEDRPGVDLLGGHQRETRRPGRTASGGRRRCACRCRCGRSSPHRCRGCAGGGRGTAARWRHYLADAAAQRATRPVMVVSASPPTQSGRLRRSRRGPGRGDRSPSPARRRTTSGGGRRPATGRSTALRLPGDRVLAKAHVGAERPHLDARVARRRRAGRRPRPPGRPRSTKSGRQREHAAPRSRAAPPPSPARCRPTPCRRPRRRRSAAPSRSGPGPRRSPVLSHAAAGPRRRAARPAELGPGPPPHSWTSSPSALGCPPASSHACALPIVGCPANGSSRARREDPQPVVGARRRWARAGTSSPTGSSTVRTAPSPRR